MRCRSWVIAGVGCFAACGGAANSPPADGPPALLVSSGDVVSRYENGRTERVARLAEGVASIALAGPDGTLLVGRRRGETRDIVRISGDAVTTAAGPEATLHDVDGTSVVYTTSTTGPDGADTGDVVVRDLTSGADRKVTEAIGPEFGVGRVSYGGGVVAVSAWTDLTESVAFYDLAGKRIEGRSSPTDDLEYNHPPFVSDAVLGPDGKSLAHMEGPEMAGDGESDARVSGWTLVVSPQPSGPSRLRLEVGTESQCLDWLDFDGRWAVLSRSAVKGDSCGDRLPVAVVDTAAGRPRLVELRDVRGLATIAGQ